MSEKRIGRPRTIDPEAVSLTALRLFDEAGYDAVSMDDVAVAAGVSRRYLFRLFPTKASLLWGGLDEFIDRLRASLDGSADGLPARAALAAAYRDAATFPPDAIEVTRHRLRVIAANPGLANEGAGRAADLTTSLTLFVATHDGETTDGEGTGGDATGGLRATVVAHAVAAAASAALTWWALSSEEPPQDVVARAVDMVVEALH